MTNDTLTFAEKMITLLDEGSFNTSYKFAVLMAFWTFRSNFMRKTIEKLFQSDPINWPKKRLRSIGIRQTPSKGITSFFPESPDKRKSSRS